MPRGKGDYFINQYTKYCILKEEGKSLQEELYVRVGILEDSGLISGKVACYAREVIDMILSEFPRVSQDKLEMFITHLSMAGKRAEEGIEENPIDRGILEAVKLEAVYPNAKKMRERILCMTDIVFPETERDFLSVHLCNLLL